MEKNYRMNSEFENCIICGKTFDGLNTIPSLEHIIPEALGNDKITSNCVCQSCNNLLGTRVDAYLSDHIFVKFIRKEKLEKDKDIKLFDSVLQEKETGKKFFVYNDHVEGMSQVIVSEKIENNGLHLMIDANSLKDGIAIARKRIKRERPDWTNEDIEKMINREGAITQRRTVFTRPILEQPVEINKSRWMMEAIKIAYEYACNLFGSEYLFDEIAQMFRSFLYAATLGKKEYSDLEYNHLRQYCNLQDIRILGQIKQLMKFRHIIVICPDMENKLICNIRILDEDLLSFTVLLSMNAACYIRNDGVCGTMILENGERIDF